MIEEIAKEKHDQLDREEENKIFNAIHRQAHFRKLEDDNKRMMSNIDKELSKDTKKRTKIKELKQKLIEDTLCFALGVIAFSVYLVLLVVLCY